MGNYYYGMLASRAERNLKHYRTKGSRNGYSTTPGYQPIGKKAQGERASSQSYLSGYGGDVVVKPAPKRDQDYRLQAVRNAAYLARQYGPSALNYIKGEAANLGNSISEGVKGAARASARLGKQFGQDAVYAGKKIGQAVKSIPEGVSSAIKEGQSRPQQKHGSDWLPQKWWVLYQGTKLAKKAADKIGDHVQKAMKLAHDGKVLSESYKDYIRQVMRTMPEGTASDSEEVTNKARKLAREAAYHNRRRSGMLRAEKACMDILDRYNEAVAKNDVESIEALSPELQKTYDAFKVAELDYISPHKSWTPSKPRRA